MVVYFFSKSKTKWLLKYRVKDGTNGSTFADANIVIAYAKYDAHPHHYYHWMKVHTSCTTWTESFWNSSVDEILGWVIVDELQEYNENKP